MDETTAKLIFAGIMGTGFVVWVISLRKALTLGRATNQPESTTFEELSEGDRFDEETGTLTVQGDPDKLAREFARAFLQSQAGMFGSLFSIKQRDGERVSLRKTGPIVCNQPPSLYFTEADLSFHRAGGGAVDVSYRIGYVRLARRLRTIALSIILGAGLPFMAVGGGLIWFLVIPNPNPAVRWQVLQTLQIVHALWPPFLFIRLYSTGRRQSKVFIENLITSLEYLD